MSTPEQINAALARWLGWTYHTPSGFWCDQHGYKAHTGKVFNPMQRIDHAWLLVERITEAPTTIEQATAAHNTKFMRWWNKSNLWAYTSRDAARAICEAMIELAGIEV